MSFHDKGIGYYIPPNLRDFGKGAYDLFKEIRPFNPENLPTYDFNKTFKRNLLDMAVDTGILALDFATLGTASIPRGIALKVGDEVIDAATTSTKKISNEKIASLIQRFGKNKFANAEEILKNVDNETLKLASKQDIVDILTKGGMENVSLEQAKKIKTIISKQRGIEGAFKIDFTTDKGKLAAALFEKVKRGELSQGKAAVQLDEIYGGRGFSDKNLAARRGVGGPSTTPKFVETYNDYLKNISPKPADIVEGKVFKAGRFYSDVGPTYSTVLKDATKRYKKDTPKFYKMYDELSDDSKVIVENFLESAVPFFAKGESRGLPMAKMRELIARMYKSKSRKGISDEDLFKQLNDVDMKALTDVLKRNQFLSNKIKDANAQGINLSTFNLSHIADVANNWKSTLDANNLYFLETKLNQIDTVQANKQIRELLEQAKKAKTKGEKDKVLEKINALGEVLESKNLITKIEGQTYGAKNVDSKSSFERIKKNLEKEYSQKDVGVVDYAGGGLATIEYMTRPLP